MTVTASVATGPARHQSPHPVRGDCLVPLPVAARRLGRSPDTLRLWHDDGHMPAVVTPGGQWSTYESFIAEIPSVGKGAVAFTMAEAGMSCGVSLRSALEDLLLAAERDMECSDMTNRDCQCGACSYALTMEKQHSVPADIAERLIAAGGAL